ncbi:MAG: hypothetical protein ACFBSG_11235 [Leptolyngbyaceae cyanobacterium]
MEESRNGRSLIDRYRRVAATLLLGMLIIFPYTFKYLNHNKEPYPAIIFPAGASRVETDSNTFEFNTTSVYCKSLKTNELEKQVVAEFMYPIPPRYFSRIVNNKFGLENSKELEVNFRKNIFPSFKYMKPPATALSAENILETKAWLKERLASQGCEENFFIIRRTTMAVDIGSREVFEKGIVDEERYEL